ncbi:sugar transferase [Runella aurantiaca]|uniref:Sugar transferase n=1 Tax=Runella aurantiaca TaxID=2282308 RepID=A0A369I4K9_9BACT|nr:sugar transferase [Runella aurantiaca]RDB04731.1 sugar transferase [Runella aurantiaca]
MKSLSPILLFVYKRLDTLQYTVNALQNNYLANESELFIFSDFAKSENDIEKVLKVREFIKTISGFKNVEIFEAQSNIGLANSIINGVNKVIERYERVIVLEDDLVTSKNFLIYMNESLNFYEKNLKILSISGYMPNINIPVDYKYSVFFERRTTSWGWATWKNRWEKIDWNIDDYQNYFSSFQKRWDFYKLGYNLYPMLGKQTRGEIDTWDVQFVLHQFKYNYLSVFPVVSKVKNIGFGVDATHTSKNINYNDSLDQSKEFGSFDFPDDIFLNNSISKKFQFNYSALNSILNRFF